MTTKVIVLLGAAGCVALLLWFLSRPSVSEGVVQVPAPSSVSASESTRDPKIQNAEHGDRRPPVALPGDSPSVGRPEVATITTSKAIDFWPRTLDVTGAIFDGTARAEDIVALSKELLSGLDLHSASKREDGCVEYLIPGDPALGTAKLIVNPSRPNKVGEYVIEVDMKRASGYRGKASDVDGSQLRLHLGHAGAGKWGFAAYVEDNLRVREDAVLAGNASAGPLAIGGVLSTSGSDVVWTQKIAEVVRHPLDGTSAWQIGFNNADQRTVEQDGFSAESLAGVQSILTTLPPP